MGAKTLRDATSAIHICILFHLLWINDGREFFLIIHSLIFLLLFFHKHFLDSRVLPIDFPIRQVYLIANVLICSCRNLRWHFIELAIVYDSIRLNFFGTLIVWLVHGILFILITLRKLRFFSVISQYEYLRVLLKLFELLWSW